MIDSLKLVVKTSDSLEQKESVYRRIAWLNLSHDLNESQEYLDSSFTILSKLDYPKAMAQLNYTYAVLFRLKNEFDVALEYIDKSYQYNLMQKDSFKIANDLFQKAVINSLKGDYKASLTDYYQILTIYEGLNKTKGVGSTLNSIGIVQKNLKQYDDAIRSYKRSINVLEGSKYLRDLANAYGNLGSAYYYEKVIDSAFVYLHKARNINKQINFEWGLSLNSLNIGEAYLYNKNYTKAIFYFEEALKIQEQNNYTGDIAQTKSGLGKVYFELGDLTKSERLLNEALAQAPDSKMVLKDIEIRLSDLYKKQRNYTRALKHYELFSKYKDSLLSKENTEYVKLLETKYQSEKKDKEITEQQLAIEKQNLKLEKQQAQTKLMTGLTVFLLLASLLTWFLYQQRQKRKDQEIVSLKREQQVKTLELLMEGEEKERLRIAKELHDGVNVDLSSIKYKLTSLLEKNNEVINEAVAMIDRSCEQVRAISHDLVPPSLKDFSLIDAVQDFCSTKNNLHEPEITFNYIGNTIAASKKTEINLFRIVQELVNNSIKHANATEIDVQLSYQENHMQLTVEDNGKGFNKDQVTRSGIGLQNINSRIEYLNAKLDFTSDSKGTSYVIDINTDELI